MKVSRIPTIKVPKDCPVCLRTGNFKFIRDYRKEDKNFFLFECPKCNVQFWLPFENAGTFLYKSSFPLRYYSKAEKFYHREFLKRHHLLSGVRVLDIGCGTGEFLWELSKKNAEVFGIDIDENATQVARQVFKLKNIYSIDWKHFFNLSHLPKFDIITFFEFLEHIDDPKEFINKVKLFLKPNGFIVISIPSRKRFLVNFCRWDFPPSHLTRWNIESIQKFLKNNGFSPYVLVYRGGFDYLLKEIILKLISANNFNEKKAFPNDFQNSKRRFLPKKDSFIEKFIKKLIYTTSCLIGPIIKLFGYTESHIYIEAKITKFNPL